MHFAKNLILFFNSEHILPLLARLA